MRVRSRLRRACAPSALAAVLAATAPAAPTSSATLPAGPPPALRINEVLATNTRLANGGTYPDLIELHNAGATAVDLGGRSLTDDPALPRKFVFPAGTTIPAGGYLVVHADAEKNAPGLHTGFALDAEGDQVRLHDTAANGGALLDSVVFGFQAPDLSISRTGAGADVWALTIPTPGAANGDALALAAPAAVRINEWAGKITFRLDHDMLELFNPAPLPVALGGTRLTDDVARPSKFVFPPLSFLAAGGYLPLYGADFVFGLDGDREVVTLFGENNEPIDQVVIVAQQPDRSGGRTPDGAATTAVYDVPTPGFSNLTPVPASYRALLANLRITEVMYQPAAAGNASDFEFIELQNIGAAPLDLGGVRFTNGLDYVFPAGTTLAGGAFTVVVNNRSAFLSRYPGLASVLAPGSFDGGLDNTGETLALSLPAPWRVHILRFRFEPTWYPSASGGGHSLVPVAPLSAAPEAWQLRTAWRASAAVNGSPGAADPGTPVPAATSRLANLSVRTTLPAGQPLIVGFVVDGGRRDLLVRAAGPSLAAFGLAGAMPDPRLQLYQGGAPEVENDNWNSTLAPTFAAVGAFPFAAGSRDAALVQTVDGARSILAGGAAGGVVLVEVYDTGTAPSPRLVNLSARNRVGTGDNILIAGFNLTGTGSRQVLVRAIGPALAGFGVTGVLADPRLELYTDAGVKLTENDNWSPLLAPIFGAVGAFALEAGSRDAALVARLEPGSYTVQVRGADGGTGEALVEIYEVP